MMNDQFCQLQTQHDFNSGVSSMDNLVSNYTRKRNKLAVEQRTTWRIKYHALVHSIREHKQQVRENPSCYRSKIELESLQTLAQIMMTERCMITFDLRDSAYKWV
jgi:hypothetical protein